MKLSEMLANYRPHMKAKLNKKIKLDNGVVLKKGTVSSILIKKSDTEYHFEAEGTACTVKESEITFI